MARVKGNKERLVPMGPRLRRYLRRYLKTREALVTAHEGSPLPYLFVTEKGSRITEGTLRRRSTGGQGSTPEKGRRKAPRPQSHVRHLAPQENPGQFAELMGHSNLSQVRKYALSDAEHACAGVAKL